MYINLPAANIINRVLRDYPLARERLTPHALARVDVHVGPIAAALRITATGQVEPVGEGASDNADAAKVTFHVPLASLPRLIKKDEAAYREIAFTGDSELAHVLSTIARNVEWDIEEDLSQLLGGGTTATIVSHRIVNGAKSIANLRDEAGQRFTENMAEYLVHERNAFVVEDDLEQFAVDNETLRDDVARLEARVSRLVASILKPPMDADTRR
jgi:ubiquinone biosynthesis accessory factor UbiJ